MVWSKAIWGQRAFTDIIFIITIVYNYNSILKPPVPFRCRREKERSQHPGQLSSGATLEEDTSFSTGNLLKLASHAGREGQEIATIKNKATATTNSFFSIIVYIYYSMYNAVSGANIRLYFKQYYFKSCVALKLRKIRKKTPTKNVGVVTKLYLYSLNGLPHELRTNH